MDLYSWNTLQPKSFKLFMKPPLELSVANSTLKSMNAVFARKICSETNSSFCQVAPIYSAWNAFHMMLF
jgi:hypothetical protein